MLAADQVERGGKARVLFGATPSILREIGARAGDVRLRPQVEVDTDGVTRKIGYAYNGLHSFPVVTAEVTSGHPIPAGKFEDGTLPIDYAGPPETIKSLSYSKVLAGHFDPQAVRGKTVIVGVSAPILGDIHATPTTNGGQMPGAEIWANGVDTLLRGAPLEVRPGLARRAADLPARRDRAARAACGCGAGARCSTPWRWRSCSRSPRSSRSTAA